MATETNLPDILNYFYSRHDKLNNTSPSSITPSSSLPPFTVDDYVVRRMFQRLNSRKAAGPDNISPCLLKLCADQLSGVFTDIFHVSLSKVKSLIASQFNFHSCTQEIHSLLLKQLQACCLDFCSHEDTRSLGPAVSEISYRSIA